MTTKHPTLPVRHPAPGRTPAARARWPRLALAAVLAVSAFLNLFRLTSEGYGNPYYSATVKNMLTGWHNFFFASFDAGFVSVDKPPLGLWIQAASAYLFGFKGWSLLLPQALAGVLCVWLVYHLVQRSFGPVAGLLAALTLALTPISVATNRNTDLESLLVLAVLLAAWAFILAVETGRLRWLLVGALLVGLAFNIKMIEAFLVLPAFYLLYLVAAPVGWWRRVINLGLATVVLLAISLSWAVAVDLTPAEQRPYVGSSSNNTVTDLIVDFNSTRMMGSDPRRAAKRFLHTARTVALTGQLPAVGSEARPRNLGRVGAVGEPEPLRLLNPQLAGQIGWLLPLAIVGLAAASWQRRPHLPFDRRHQDLVMWGMWFVTLAVVFSAVRKIGAYYLVMLAPAVAALVGVGLVALWNDYRSPGRRGWLLPLTLAGTAALQTYILVSYYPDWGYWLAPTVGGLCLVAAMGLAGVRLGVRLNPRLTERGYPLAAISVAMLSLLIAPSTWVVYEAWYGGGETRSPTAGPLGVQGTSGSGGAPPTGGSLEGGSASAGPPGGSGAQDPTLLDYLLANQGDAEYLVAATDALDLVPIILRTDEPVISLGGFKGLDQVFSTDELADLVNEGSVRFFLIQESESKNESTGWVQDNCERVPQESWQSSASEQTEEPKEEDLLLYDCGAGAR